MTASTLPRSVLPETTRGCRCRRPCSPWARPGCASRALRSGPAGEGGSRHGWPRSGQRSSPGCRQRSASVLLRRGGRMMALLRRALRRVFLLKRGAAASGSTTGTRSPPRRPALRRPAPRSPCPRRAGGTSSSAWGLHFWRDILNCAGRPPSAPPPAGAALAPDA